ncbi:MULTISPECIES: hypothetical protein [unclassified Moorena]|uniref:hypothetical protein n=1 Tax=unclassified Moorena TaxID=2683338 RepID=UPI0002E10230|nr:MULTISPECIES: hypothetical protein [unclassified Moorena]NEQ09490.1 hypothetical protein [Moorena sp. SIO4E2]NER90719.1 hypothetical protein [Moorena sp. SIO3A2]NES44658.1 hypothetical protein [Moorena sp. SIO2C4]NET68628.1 hypothetical protein [Moorena sp. SIO1G6]
MSVRFQTKPDVILFYWPKATLREKTRSLCKGGNPPRNLAMQRGLGEPVRSWGFPP